jgi:hypothetical protein
MEKVGRRGVLQLRGPHLQLPRREGSSEFSACSCPFLASLFVDLIRYLLIWYGCARFVQASCRSIGVGWVYFDLQSYFIW